MWVYRDETEMEELEKELKEKLGRELTPREKFYIALSQACITRQVPSQDELTGHITATGHSAWLSC
jgi:hypothetical protein